MLDRAELIIQYFNYLIADYGFSIAEKKFDLDTMGNAYVVFASPKIGIEVVVDRNEVLISIGDRLDPRRQWFEFTDVIKYFAPSLEQAYIFPEKAADKTWDDVVEAQLNRLATILRQYCEPLLKGELWMKSEIRQMEEKRTAEILENLNRMPKQHGED